MDSELEMTLGPASQSENDSQKQASSHHPDIITSEQEHRNVPSGRLSIAEIQNAKRSTWRLSAIVVALFVRSLESRPPASYVEDLTPPDPALSVRGGIGCNNRCNCRTHDNYRAQFCGWVYVDWGRLSPRACSVWPYLGKAL